MTESLVGAGAVTLGALIGSSARFFLSGFIARRAGETFPWGTLVVNVSGSFLIGVFAAFAQAQGIGEQSPWWLLLVTGVLGSYTTVSSFSLQTRALLRDRETARAFANTTLSLGLCVLAAGLGFALVTLVAGSLAA